LAQVERFDELVQTRIDHAELDTSLLIDFPGIVAPPTREGIKNVFWMYSILIQDEFGILRDELRTRLAKRVIETRMFFIPIHL
jgi:perosamine synthetase